VVGTSRFLGCHVTRQLGNAAGVGPQAHTHLSGGPPPGQL